MRHFSPIHLQTAADPKAPCPDATIGAPEPASAGRQRVAVWLVICAIVLIAAIVSATVALISSFRDRELADTERELENLAYTLSEQVDRAFQALELVQRSTIERMDSLGIATREDFKRRMSTHDMYLMLKDKISGLPQVEAVSLFDTDGNLVNFSRFWPLPDLNVSDRDYFKALVSDPRLTSFLSNPVLNRTTGTRSIYLERKFTAVNGELLGLVMVGIRLAYFEEVFRSIALSEGGAISLFRSDGTLLARHPRVADATAPAIDRNLEFRDPRQQGDRGTGRVVGPDGEDRLVSWHRLANYPGVLSVSTTTSSALADWRRVARFLAAAAGLSVFVIAAIVFILVRQLVRGQQQVQGILDAQTLKLNTALDNMSQGLCMFDSSARLVLCNQRYLQMYGLAPETVGPGVTLREIIDHRRHIGAFDGDVEQYCAETLAAIATGATGSRLIEMRDGRTIRNVSQPMDNGWWVATDEDITEQRRAEKELERSKSFFDLVIENVPTTIWVRSARDQRYVLVNRAAEQLWGLGRKDILGKTAAEVFPEAEAEVIGQRDRQLMRADQQLVFDEHTLNTPGNGTRIVTSKRIAIRQNGQDQYLLGVVEDVTERKMIERQLQQAQKMEAVGNLTGGLAHDFNNLLLIIIANLDLLQEDLAGNAPAEEKIETILTATLRGAELTRQLLAFSRRQPLRPKRLDVNALINNTMRLLMRTLGETITYDLRLGSDLWAVYADEAQLESAMVNIAINARDAMIGGGTLTIATSNMHVDTDFAVLHAEFTPGDYVTIEITDTGTGMPAEVVARIFEPFFTTKSPGKGTGLGLSMVYGFMKQSKGHISAYSEVGIGTTFRMYLPRDTTAGAQVNAQSPAQRPVPRARDGEVILVVDDNVDVRTAVSTQLQELGYAVHQADSALKALDRLDSSRVDLLFTDMVMPGGLTGKGLAEKARVKFPELKVLFTSGFPEKSGRDGHELEPGDRLLSKPYRKRDLAQAVRDLLDQQPSPVQQA